MEEPGDVVQVAFAKCGGMRHVLVLSERIRLRIDHVRIPVVDLQFLCRDKFTAFPHMAYDLIH